MRVDTIVLIAGLATMLLGVVSATPQKVPSQADRIFARAKDDDYMGDSGCKDCHEDRVANFHASGHAAFMSDPKLPNSKKGCEGCHGAGYVHQADENPEVVSFTKFSPKESSAACLRCHESSLPTTHWKDTAHAEANLSCVSCHQIHAESEPDLKGLAPQKSKAKDPRTIAFAARVQPKSLLKADEATLCGQCHAGQVTSFKLNSHHPIPEGKMVCSECHSVHPTKGEKAHMKDAKGKCVTCHTEFAGPFIYEHDPVSSGSGDACMECHKPHGSNNPKMLNSFSRGLCAQCHTERLGTHYPGRTCWTAGCHSAPHGSNHSPALLEP